MTRVRVLVHAAAELGSVGDPHDDGAAGQRAEVDADHVLLGHASRPPCQWSC